MERTKYLIIAIVCLTFRPGFSQKSYKTEMYNAYIGNNMQTWKTLLLRFEADMPAKNEQRIELVNYYYGYIAYCIGTKQTDEAEYFLNQAEKQLEILEKAQYLPADIYAYKSAFTGFKIGLNPFKAPFIGGQSVDYAKKAIKIAPTQPLGYVQFGNAMYYMPAMFGGSKTEGIDSYLKALNCYKLQGDTLNNWNYINLLGHIGKAYMAIGDYENAGRYFTMALKVEPGFRWVRDELMKELNKKTNAKK